MTNESIYAGMPLDEETKAYFVTQGKTLSITRGTHYSLDEDRVYLVRTGENPVAMPCMKYSESAEAAVKKLYEKEGEDDG